MRPEANQASHIPNINLELTVRLLVALCAHLVLPGWDFNPVHTNDLGRTTT